MNYQEDYFLKSLSQYCRDGGIYMKVKASNILYFLMIFLSCGSYMISHSTIPKVYENSMIIIHLFDYISYVLGIWLIIKSKHPKRYIIYYAIVVLFLLISSILARDVIMLKGLIIVIASKDIEIKKIINNYLVVITLFTFIIGTLCLLNKIPDVTEIRSNTGNIRYSLGLSHPNRLGYILFLFSMTRLYNQYLKYGIRDIIFNTLMLAISVYISNSKSVAVLITIISIIELYFILFPKRNTLWIKELCKMILILAPLLSWLTTIMYNTNNAIYLAINEFFTGRLYLANTAYKKYGFSILGQKIDSVLALEASRAGTEVLAIDNFYTYITIHFGIIIIFIIITAFAMFVKKAISNTNNDILLLWFFLIIIYGMFENQIIDLRINFPVVILFCSLIKNSDKFYFESQDYVVKRKFSLRL